MATKVKPRTIIIHADDSPTVKDIVDTVSRLKKDYRLLSKIRGSKDIEDPQSFKNVIVFLESFLKKGKRKLDKDAKNLENIFNVSVESLIDLIEEEPELAKEIIKSTHLKDKLNNLT